LKIKQQPATKKNKKNNNLGSIKFNAKKPNKNTMIVVTSKVKNINKTLLKKGS